GVQTCALPICLTASRTPPDDSCAATRPTDQWPLCWLPGKTCLERQLQPSTQDSFQSCRHRGLSWWRCPHYGWSNCTCECCHASSNESALYRYLSIKSPLVHAVRSCSSCKV